MPAIAAPDPITVRVFKYDGTEYRHWHARLARREGSLLVLDAEFESDVQHDLLGDIRSGTRTIEYYWLDRWYNIFRFLTDHGATRLYYCNINIPPALKDGVLTYIDLDIDVLVRPDLSYQILDLEEFEENAVTYRITEEVRTRAHTAVDELIEMINSRRFPFVQADANSSVSSVVN